MTEERLKVLEILLEALNKTPVDDEDVKVKVKVKTHQTEDE
jgi:hypothetical protein